MSSAIMATDIGTRLQQAREARGLTLQDVARTTKITTAALSAVEHNDFSRLPGGVFRRAYVRGFADAVGLDADELVAEYRAAFEPEVPVGAPSQGGRFSDRLERIVRWLRPWR